MDRLLMRKYLMGVGSAVLLSASFGVSAGISGSKHDLTVNGSGSNHLTAGAAEICVFCHTPHGSDSAAPLWNKDLTAGATRAGSYSLYTSSTLEATADVTGGVSLACLSCHDGSQAMDTMINAPGSGLQPGGDANPYDGAGYTWTTGNAKMLSTSVANLGGAATNQDFTNDHPIMIPYCGGGYSTGGGTGSCADKDFNTPSVSGTKVWFDSAVGVPDRVASTKDRTDIQLYNRGSGVTYFVECGSCHDPHNTTNLTFLRQPNTGSAVCLACHNK